MTAVASHIRSTPGRLRLEPGSATVELAAAIPLLVAVTLAMVGLLGLARDQVLAQGAAREAAREAAIGGDPGVAIAVCLGLGAIYLVIGHFTLRYFERLARERATLSLA